jgi:hypothetical protein
MIKRNRWLAGGRGLWYVFGENQSIWLSTANFSRKGAIEEWERQTGGPWRKWYRKGFRCQRAKIKYQIQPS